MNRLVGAQAIAKKLSALVGLPVSQWQVYRLAKSKTTPIERDEEGVMLCATVAGLEHWYHHSRLAPIFAKQVERARGRPKAVDMPTLRIIGVVGEDELTDTRFMESIDALGNSRNIRVQINSDGGRVSHGLAIYHALRAHSAAVEVEILGVAASMASAIAMAGDKVSMAEDALFMLHDPWLGAVGNAAELRAAAEMLEKHGESLAGIYARKTGMDEDAIKEMMSKDGGEGTWLNSREALEAGFIDEILSPAKAQLPQLPAVALAKRIHSNGGTQPMKGKLAAALKAALKALVTAGTTHDTVVAQVAESAGVQPEVINQILEKKADTLKAGDLQAIATALDVDFNELQAAAEEDEIEITADKPAARGGPTKPAAKPIDSGVDVQAAVREAIREERKRQQQVSAHAVSQAKKFGVPQGEVAEITAGCETTEEVNAKILDYLSSNQRSVFQVSAGNDDHDKWLEGMGNWLVIKSGHRGLIEAHAKKTGSQANLDAGNFRGMRLIDICRDVLERNGISVRGMTPMDIAKRALQPRADAGLGTTSDFPLLLENVLHKLLQAAYDTAPDQWRNVAAIGSVQDFRANPRYRLGSLPRLSKLLENGEFETVNFPDAEKETIQADTLGNVIGLTRQSIVNDDMDGFARVVTMLGRAAARSIEIDLFALFELNSGLGPTMRDGKALFHADHNNIDGTGGAPSVATLDAGRVLMAQQKDPNSNDFLDLRPDVFVGPIGKGAAVRTAVNSEFDFDAGGSNPKFMKPNVVRGLLSTIVDTPRLSGNRWYLIANPSIAPVFEVVFLEGQESPVIETMEGFDFDGVKWRIRHDYGVGATDFRGATTNAGA